MNRRRFVVYNEDRKGAREPDGRGGEYVWGPEGESGDSDSLIGASGRAQANWDVARGRNLLIVKDTESGAVVARYERLPRWRSWWWEARDVLRERRKAVAEALRRPGHWLAPRWTIQYTLTVITIFIAALGLYVAFVKQTGCVENHWNRCKCTTGEGWQVCRDGAYTECECRRRKR
jgi:hypothetical protein